MLFSFSHNDVNADVSVDCFSCNRVTLQLYFGICIFCSVKQHKLFKGSSNVWPPFRIPGPLHPAFIGLTKLLHCRTMHGLIFILLYKVRSTSISVLKDFVMDKVYGYSLYGETFLLLLFSLRLESN